MRNRTPSTLFAAALAALVTLTTGRLAAQQSPTEFAPHPDMAALKHALQRPVQVEFQNVALHEAVAFLSQRLRVDLRIDHRALNEEAFDESIPVRLSASQTTLQQALDSMLYPHELTWMPRHGAIYITTRDAAEQNQTIRVYPVMDLVAQRSGNRVSFDFDSLIHVIETTIEPDNWESSGGMGTVAAHPQSAALICSQTWHNHQRLEALLDALRKAKGLQKIDWDIMELEAFTWPRAQSPLSNRSIYASESAWRVPRIYRD